MKLEAGFSAGAPPLHLVKKLKRKQVNYIHAAFGGGNIDIS